MASIKIVHSLEEMTSNSTMYALQDGEAFSLWMTDDSGVKKEIKTNTFESNVIFVTRDEYDTKRQASELLDNTLYVIKE